MNTTHIIHNVIIGWRFLKRPRLSLISIFLFVFTFNAFSQAEDDAIFIYRNDGHFNAFFRAEIDSMTYSYYNLDSLLCNDVVTQVIYTQDSIYRIPLEAIDSIGFFRPEIILQPNVVKMENGLLDYIKSVDGMSLTFNHNLPKELKPTVGQILVCTDFDNPLFEDGFVGKIVDSRVGDEGIIIECDTVYDITEIFEQLISIEAVQLSDEDSLVKARRAPSIWEGKNIPLTLKLDFQAGELSMFGQINGHYMATIAYDIRSRKDHHIEVRVNHDWQFEAGLSFINESGEFGKYGNMTMFGRPVRFPIQLPIFKFQVGGQFFIRGEGEIKCDVGLQGPVHSYLLSGTIHNGKFEDWNNKKLENAEGAAFDSYSEVSLNGYAHAGYLVEFSIGTIECLGYLKAAVDCYVGPKISGNLDLNISSSNTTDLYNSIKDAKLSFDPLSVYIDAYGEAGFMNQKPLRYHFLEYSFVSPLSRDWYFLPEFSDLTVETDMDYQLVTVGCTPHRDIIYPVSIRLGLYDSENNEVDPSTYYDSNDVSYRLESDAVKLNLLSWVRFNEKYTVRPIISFNQIDIPATPCEEIFLEKFPVEISQFEVINSFNDPGFFINDGSRYDYRFDAHWYVSVIADAEDLDIADWGYVYEDPNGRRKEISLSEYGTSYEEERYAFFRNQPHSTARLYGYIRFADSDETLYGEPQDFPLDYDLICPDDNHPHMIDLGLPSGLKWSCCNLGASKPEEYGSYYAWGETSTKTYYSLNNYEHYNQKDKTWTYLGAHINGTEYDAARTNWGAPWRMHKIYEWLEIKNKCTIQETVHNGTCGIKVKGLNGKCIFIPASGFAWPEAKDVGILGYYWCDDFRSADHAHCFYYDTYSLSDYQTEELLGDLSNCVWSEGLGYRCYGFTIRPVAE